MPRVCLCGVGLAEMGWIGMPAQKTRATFDEIISSTVLLMCFVLCSLSIEEGDVVVVVVHPCDELMLGILQYTPPLP